MTDARRAALATLGLLLLSAAPSRASGPAAAAAAQAPPAAAVAPPPADVLGGNRPVVTLRGLLFQNPPAERARVASERIEKAIERGRDLTVAVREDTAGRLLTVGDRGAFVLVEGDVDEASGETLDQVAAAAAARLTLAISEARERRSLPDLLKAVGLSVVATAVLVFVVLLLERVRRWAGRKAADAAHRRLGDLQISGRALVEKDRVYWVTTRLVLLLTRVVDLVALYVWLAFVLERFAWTRPWGEHLGDWFLKTSAMLGVAALRALPDLAIVGLIFIATRWLLRGLAFLFSAIEDGRIEVSQTLRETTQPTRRIVTVVVWVFALIMAYPYLPGSGTEAFKGIGVMVGLMVSLGSSALIGQLASGFMLMYSRTLRVGDFVRAGDLEGTVVQLGLFATRIRTNKREIITIPNTVLAGQVTKNYTQAQEQQPVVVGTGITIGYDTPWRQVEGLLLLAAERTPGIRTDPPPWVNQRSLGDFYVDYELCAALEDATQRVRTLTALHSSILDAFNEFGVQITSPNYEADPEAPKVVPREQWFAAPARRTPGEERRGA
ncbi:MAG: mechanosensitive ion channel family protein [Thermoanaerobaculia bacterium]|nr:mechanosensitive ion channel family protein [Thermoanaerobaculia bacterium]